ncbi:MAG: amidohydrolase family protein [Treponema sp.]|jgi:cytosine/adenosine deaminase-related metal-dependent hydrolase|nr:amidohydrolase family protein [Treponema sp.]
MPVAQGGSGVFLLKDGPELFDYSLKNGLIVSKGQKPQSAGLTVKGEIIGSSGAAVSLDLKGASVVYPALINTHDHLQGNYRPPVGPKPGSFYLTWLPWDNDLKASDTFKERSQLSREDLYNLSGYKCLFSGVATVNDHFPQKFNRKILPTLPIRAILEYGLAHETSSYDLKWGDGVETEHERAVKNKWPFITHLCEGFDEESMRGVEDLEKLKILDSHCLFIHCIGFSDKDIEKVAKAGASVSWCGFSNMFMFNVTCKIRKMLRAGVNLTIGTDSSATGSANLLAEMKYDRDLYRRLYGEDLSAQTMFEMVTANAARAFWMQDRTGVLEKGKLADILVVKGKHDDPYENLLCSSMEDIELLTLEGVPIYGEFRFLDLFGSSLKKGELPEGYTAIEVGGRRMFVKGDPAGLYREARCKIGFKKVLDYLPFEPD